MGKLKVIASKMRKTTGPLKAPEYTIALKKKEEMENDKNLNILYIFVSEDSKYKIKGKKLDKVGVLRQEYKQLIGTFKDELYRLASSEDDIKERGAKIYEGLIPSKVREALKNEKIDWVWIDCRRKEINCLWEWLYTKNAGDFFWGDEFIIIRLPKNCDLKGSDLQINNSTILIDNYCPAKNDMGYLRELLSKAVTPIELNRLGNLGNLNNSDCIHVGSNRDAFEKYIREVVKSASLLPENQFFSKLLFLNICESDTQADTQDLILELIDLIAAETWIYTGWDVPGSFAHLFAKYFYDEFKITKKNVAEAVTNARKEIRELPEKNLSVQKFWRLAYVATGDPHIDVSWAEG